MAAMSIAALVAVVALMNWPSPPADAHPSVDRVEAVTLARLNQPPPRLAFEPLVEFDPVEAERNPKRSLRRIRSSSDDVKRAAAAFIETQLFADRADVRTSALRLIDVVLAGEPLRGDLLDWVDHLRNSDDEHEAAAAVSAWMTHAESGFVEVAEQALASDRIALASAASDAVIAAERYEATPALRRYVFADGPVEIRLQAARALFELDDPVGLEHLVEMAHCAEGRMEDPRVVLGAFARVKQRASTGVVEALARCYLSSSHDPALMASACEALGARGIEVTREELAAALELPPIERLDAEFALAASGDPEAERRLVDHLDSDDGNLRWKACERLIRLRPGRYVDAVRRALATAPSSHYRSEIEELIRPWGT